MLKDRTVFVIGAGLSAELNMPLGSDLKLKIVDVLPTDRSGGLDAARSALMYGANQHANWQACAAIRAGLPAAASIDNFVEHRAASEAIVHCAKVGIVGAILQGERHSKIYTEPSETQLRPEVHGSTFGALFRLIVGNCGTERLAEAFQRVAFVNFNYDRCLEQYLFSTLIHHSGLSAGQARDLVDSLSIWHPYGTIGLPEWSAKESPGVPKVRFGCDPEQIEMGHQAEGIRTFSEERGSSEDRDIKQALAQAAQVIFLGCAFHRQNMRLIEPDDTHFEAAYGTCYLPPPKDPWELANETMADFAEPTATAFRRTLSNWRKGAAPTDAITFEPLTSLQLVTKYGAEWEST